jgi:L-threonylcarbamoyladenylate synthase
MKTIKLKDPDEAAAVAVEFLVAGGIAVMPMDTSYGLAVDATNQTAVDELFDLKGRDRQQSISVVVRDREHAGQIGRFSQPAARLWDVFMPGSLTLVVPYLTGAKLARGVTAGGQTIGLRQPKHDLSQLVAERFGKPYTATSANRAGQPPAYAAAEFLDQLPDGLAPHLLIDGGELPLGKSSTVVSVVRDVEILRDGAIPAELIQEALA